jgi:hypothetical protein
LDTHSVWIQISDAGNKEPVMAVSGPEDVSPV